MFQSERSNNICPRKIVPLEQQRVTPNLRQGVRRAIADVQLRGMTLTFPVQLERLERLRRLFAVERDDRNAGGNEPGVKIKNPRSKLRGIGGSKFWKEICERKTEISEQT